jgi:CubicO group peptidase (beta-lactamase class C family)
VDDIQREIDQVAAEADFHGTVRIDRDGQELLARAYGLAHRGYAIANTVDTRFGIASGGKTFTALAVVHLVERGLLEMTTTARSILGDDLPLIDDAVTIEHLLAHRSGIGDYLDEDMYDDFDQYILPVPVQELATTEQFLPILDGYPQRFPPGERFSYCNGGYVVLALIAERVSGEPYHDLVVRTVCEPAGMTDTGFPRSDQPDGRTALGYLHRGGAWRTNVFHLPVRATGDGGIHSTVGDISAFGRHQRVLDVAARRAHRLARVGRRDVSSSQRLARVIRPLRLGILVGRDRGPGGDGGGRRRHVVLEHARPLVRHDDHGDVEHLRRHRATWHVAPPTAAALRVTIDSTAANGNSALPAPGVKVRCEHPPSETSRRADSYARPASNCPAIKVTVSSG